MVQGQLGKINRWDELVGDENRKVEEMRMQVDALWKYVQPSARWAGCFRYSNCFLIAPISCN